MNRHTEQDKAGTIGEDAAGGLRMPDLRCRHQASQIGVPRWRPIKRRSGDPISGPSAVAIGRSADAHTFGFYGFLPGKGARPGRSGDRTSGSTPLCCTSLPPGGTGGNHWAGAAGLHISVARPDQALKNPYRPLGSSAGSTPRRLNVEKGGQTWSRPASAPKTPDPSLRALILEASAGART